MIPTMHISTTFDAFTSNHKTEKKWHVVKPVNGIPCGKFSKEIYMRDMKSIFEFDAIREKI